MNKYACDKEDSLLVLVDFQEKLMPAMKDAETLEETVLRLVKGAKVLSLPILFTQQYTKGLGETVPGIRETLDQGTPIEKVAFSCAAEPDFVNALKTSGRKTVLLAGIETHICVAQTCLDLLDMGYRVFLVEDAVSSRKESDRISALQRMDRAGAHLITYEALLFQLLGSAMAPEFKEISRIVK